MKAKADFPDINSKRPDGLKPDGNHFRVLVVDDSVFVQKQLTQILVSEAYEVAATAADGKQGIERYRELFPNVDLVTLDITMPGVDGVTCLQQIMEFDKNAHVVMVSALGRPDLVKKCFVLGAKNYIVKPLDRAKVLERFRAVLQG